MPDWFYPYKRLFGDVALKLDSFRIDGEEVPDGSLDQDRREVRLLDLEREEWEAVDLDLVLSGPMTELGEWRADGTEPTAFAVAHCAASNMRQAVRLQPDPGNSSRWRGTLELQRSNWFGRIDLRGSLVASVGGERDRTIGTPDPWVVRLDDVPPPPVSGAIKTLWHDFTAPDEELAWLQEHKAEPMFLRLENEQPIVYLNRGFEGLKALLDRKPKRERGEQALHDEARAAIAAQVWAAMFNAAVQAIRDEDGEAPDWPEEPWKRTALEMLLDRVYPDKPPEDALQEIAEMRRDESLGGALQQALLIAASKHVGGARLLRGAIKHLGTSLQEA
jgi:predicted NUDIX family NTP pyrophosphohydrolase